VKKIISFLGNILFWAVLMLMAVMVFFLVKGKIDREGVPRVAGYQLYIVLSGSMHPVFDAGSILAVKPAGQQEIQVGDIVTFKDPEDQKKIVTHRVVKITDGSNGRFFVTKGDANEAPDPNPVPGGNVIGKAVLWVPYAGYVLDFAKTKKGLLFIIVIPGTLFILAELFNLYRLVQQAEEEEKRAKGEVAGAEAPEGKGC
jgi:signal peptidase